MKNFLKALLIISTVGLVVIFTGCATSSENQTDTNNKIQVTSTIFPIYDIAKTIGGDYVTSHVILSPGASPHTFSPTPSDIRRLDGTQLLFTIGHGLDDWTSTITDSLGEMETVNVSSDITLYPFTHEHEHAHGHDHGEHEHAHGHDHDGHDHGDQVDPHYWLNTANGIKIASTITDALCESDPENADYYKQNLASYTEDLNALHAEIVEKLETLDNRNLIVFHESWNYFAREFDLTIAGVVQTSPGKEPSPQYLEKLYSHAQEHNVKVVFSEPQLSPDTLRPFVEDLGLTMYTLDPLGGLEKRDSYINMLRYNAETIYEALNQ